MLIAESNRLLEAARQLTPLPAATAKLTSLSSQSDADLRVVSEVIASDPVMTLKILKAANSAASGSAMRITTVNDAMLRLGLGMVVSLALSGHTANLMRRMLAPYRLTPGELWHHAVASSCAAEVLLTFSPTGLPPLIVPTALLHDIGKPVIEQAFTEAEAQAFLRIQTEKNLDAFHAEMQLLGGSHADVGATVARHWRLPETMARCIQLHHSPHDWPELLGDALHLANVVAKRLRPGRPGEPPPPEPLARSLAILELKPVEFDEVCEASRIRYERLAAAFL
jgi:putative nucleotidyltransferase with HDIG domain